MQALEFSRRGHLEDIDVERLIGDDAFEATILVLKRLHLRDVADFHAPKLRFPVVKRSGADAVLSAEILSCDAGFVLFEDADDLRFAEPRLFHGRSLLEAGGLRILHLFPEPFSGYTSQRVHRRYVRI